MLSILFIIIIMGCQCTKSNLVHDKEIKTPSTRLPAVKQKNQNPLSSQRQKNIINNYKERALYLINQARKDPSSYSDLIQSSIKNIKEDGNNLFYEDNNIKVKLYKGEPAFLEAEEQLRMMEGLPPLEFKEEICISLPTNKEQIQNKEFIVEKAKEVNSKWKLDAYFIEKIKDPDMSILLMIVDDNGKNSGKKRASLFNPKYKYIGINFTYVDNFFIAYYSFSS